MGHGRGRGKTNPISTSRALAPVVLMGACAHATERLAASPRLRGDDIATDRASAPNKPNFGASDLEDKCRVNKELRPIGCTSGPRKTKPISGGVLEIEASSVKLGKFVVGFPHHSIIPLFQSDAACTNRANLTGWGRPRGPGYPTIPVFYHSTIPRQTNPILARAIWRISVV